MRAIPDTLRRLRGDARGAIGVLSAFVLVGVIGVSALALEYGHGLLQKAENQRVADLAAFGGALVYGSTSSTSNATSAVSNIVALNGLSGDSTGSVINSPTGDGNKAVEVTVTSHVPLLLARVLTTNTTMAVSATAYAEVKFDAPACIIALSGSGAGVGLTGGATLSAAGCAVASNAAVTTHACSNTITTGTVDYNSSTAPPLCSLVPPTGKTSVQTNKVLTTDPLSPSSGSPGSTEITNAAARISTVSAIASPSAPSVSSVSGGSAVDFGWSTMTGSLPGGCSASLSSSVWTATCTGSGPFIFGTITHNGGVTVNFQTSSGATYYFAKSIPSGVGLTGSGAATYNFTGSITTAGTTSFAPGTYNIAGSIITTGTTTFGAGTYNVTAGISVAGSATFGAGTFNIGKSASSCAGSTGYSICTGGGAALVFGGPSTFVLQGGIYNGGGSALTMGSGGSNSYNIGKSGDGNSINAGTSQIMTLADATGSGDIFQTAGSITSGGGSCLAIPAAAEHDINGSINGSGGIVLGSGIYTVNGYVALGNGGGGDVSNCPTSGITTGLDALGVSLVISGASTVNCGGVTSAFCLGAGYATVDLTAPTSSSTLGGSAAGLAVIGPQSSSNTAAAALTTGATSTRISGAFYFPNGPVKMSGAATLQDTDSSDTSRCLELIGSEIDLSAGSAAGTTCAGLSGGSLGTTVTLVK